MAGIVVLAVVAVALVLGLRADAGTTDAGAPSSSESPATRTDEIPSPTVEPDGLGDDPVFDLLAQECYDGDMLSCDALYQETRKEESLAAYTEFADTCAGRQEAGTGEYCSTVFPGN